MLIFFRWFFIAAIVFLPWALHAQVREFSYVTKNSGLNQIPIDAACESVGSSTNCPVLWPSLTHAALLGNSNWYVFVTPTTITNLASSVISAPVPSENNYPDDYFVQYTPFADGRWVIGQRETSASGGVPQTTHPIFGEFGVAAVESTDPSVIVLDIPLQTTSTLEASPYFLVDHPLLNNLSDVKPFLTLIDPAVSGASHFCGRMDYSSTLNRWYITSACYGISGDVKQWGPVRLAIKVVPAGGYAFTHRVTISNLVDPPICPRAQTQCSIIDNGLVNNNPNAVLIASRGAKAPPNKVNFSYNYTTNRWQLECIPYYPGFDSPRTVTNSCTLSSNANYFIWVPNADQTILTTTLSTSSNPLSLNIASTSIPGVRADMQQFVTTPIGPIANPAQNFLSYLPMSSTWTLWLNDGARFAPGSSFGIHAFSGGQNTYLHRVTAENTSAGITSAIDHPLLNNGGDNKYFVIQGIYSPGFNIPAPPATTPANEHVGLYWDGTYWTIALENPSPGHSLSIGSHYAVLIPRRFQGVGDLPAMGQTRASRHVADMSNTVSNCTLINHPIANNNLHARVFFSHVIRDQTAGTAGEIRINSGFTAQFDSLLTGRWGICRNDGEPMPPNAKFNVIIYEDFVSQGLDFIFSNGFEN